MGAELDIAKQLQQMVLPTLDLGFPIGLDEGIADFIAQERVQLNAGDVAVLYTDGITKAENRDRVQYGLGRLCNVIQEFLHQSLTDHYAQALGHRVGWVTPTSYRLWIFRLCTLNFVALYYFGGDETKVMRALQVKGELA